MARREPNLVPLHEGERAGAATAEEGREGGEGVPQEIPQEGGGGGNWEAELASQRDAALAMARELSSQLDRQRETLERRAKTAEALQDISRKAHRECLERRERRHEAPEVHVRLAALVGGSLSAWLLCAALGLAWAPKAALALGLPCTLVMAALCLKRLPKPSTKRRRD